MERRRQLVGIALMILGCAMVLFYGGAAFGRPSQLAVALSLGMPLGICLAAGVAVFAAGVSLARARRPPRAGEPPSPGRE